MEITTFLVLWVALAAVSFYVLFHVIRAAVLNALRQHTAEVTASTRPQPASHLDADGM